MKIAIIGQDTLAAATRECCRRHCEIVIPEVADLVWVCYDTPISDDIPDSDWVLERIGELLLSCNQEAIMLVSSQMPVGTIAHLEGKYPAFKWAYSPENIRVATAVTDFENQDRIVLGVRDISHADSIKPLLMNFTRNVIVTNPETAEMCKHALNCWLGMNIAFINEIARICAVVGADVDRISEALKSERRISPKAPLKAGGPFGGGHLARDIHTLCSVAKASEISIPIINSIINSNQT